MSCWKWYQWYKNGWSGKRVLTHGHGGNPLCSWNSRSSSSGPFHELWCHLPAVCICSFPRKPPPRGERTLFSSQVSSSGLGCLSGASRIISDGWLWVSNLIILSVASCLHLFFLEDTLLHPGLSTGGFQLPWCGASSHLCWMLETHNLMLFHCLSATSYFYFDIYKYIADFSFASKKMVNFHFLVESAPSSKLPFLWNVYVFPSYSVSLSVPVTPQKGENTGVPPLPQPTYNSVISVPVDQGRALLTEETHKHH